MQIIIPMAGRGTRVSGDKPKPLLEVANKPIVEWAISTLNIPGKYTYITRTYEKQEWNDELNHLLRKLTPDCNIIPINYTTEGPACSALLATINSEPLIIANCDQAVFWNSTDFLSYVKNNDCDGCLVTYNTNKSANSYAAVDSNGRVTKVVEKQVISQYSLNGIHYLKNGLDFVQSAQQMIINGERYNNEFYVGPTYNQLTNNKYIRVYNINPEQHYALGMDIDLDTFKERISANR